MKERYGFDTFRYFLLRDMVFGLDSNFSEEGHDIANQCRPGEQSGKPGESYPQHDGDVLRGRDASPSPAHRAMNPKSGGPPKSRKRRLASEVDRADAKRSRPIGRSRRSFGVVDERHQSLPRTKRALEGSQGCPNSGRSRSAPSLYTCCEVASDHGAPTCSRSYPKRAPESSLERIGQETAPSSKSNSLPDSRRLGRHSHRRGNDSQGTLLSSRASKSTPETPRTRVDR